MQSLHTKIFICLAFVFFIGCTKYVASNKNANSSSSSSSGSSSNPSSSSGGSSSGSNSGSSSSGSSTGSSSGSGANSSGSGTVGGGSGSGSSSSGGNSGGSSTGSGSGSSSGSGSGSNTGSSGGNNTGGNTSNQTAQTYLQVLDYTRGDNTYRFWADSTFLNKDGSYSTLNAGTHNLGFSWSNTSTFKLGSYGLSQYSFNSVVYYLLMNGVGQDGTFLPNGSSTPGVNRAFVRFINIDFTSKTSPQNYFFESYADNFSSSNRTYKDHETNTTFTDYKDVYATTATITVKDNAGKVLRTFMYAFDKYKKYTIFSIADHSSGNNLIYIGQHN